MTLIDENELIMEQEKKKKMFKIITRAIIILLVLCIILLIFSNVIKKNAFKCYIDNSKNTSVKNDILMKDDNGRIYMENDNVYISISKLANVLNLQCYNSEYKKKGEDKSKCQVKNENIYTSFIAGSNQIYKAIEEQIPESKDKKNNVSASKTSTADAETTQENKKVDFEYFQVSDRVRWVNNELYASIEAIELGLDVVVDYNKKDNTLRINTLKKLEQTAKYARKDAVDSSEYNYKNKRLLKYGLVIVKDAEQNYGVASYTNTEKLGSFVASCKYQSIDFDESTKSIYVVTKNDSKKSILCINLDKQQVESDINTPYDDIKTVTDDFKYFMVKQNEKFGIVGNDGNPIIPIEFEEIGVKEEIYTDITNKYILADKYVPVKLNGQWGLYNLEGTEIIPPQFADIGCNLAQSGDSSIVISNLKDGKTGIVFLYNKEKSLYGVYDAESGKKIAVSLAEVFKRTENGEENYYVNHIIDGSSSKVHTINLRKDL